jgi:hypothetical protein
MIKTIRILLLPLAMSAAFWCSTGISTSYELAETELNLGDGASDGFFSSYWNTFYCQIYVSDPACASAAPNPYYGPAWYNFNYGGWGFEDGGLRHREGRDRNHGGRCGSGRCGRGGR